MKYYVNEEGVRALKATAAALENSVDNIAQAVGRINGVIDEHSNVIGPHESILRSACDGIATSVKNDFESVYELSGKLQGLAEAYQDIIDDDPFPSRGARVKTR